MEKSKPIKVLVIFTIVFASIAFGALVGALCTLQTYREYLYIYLIVVGIASFIAVVLTIIILTIILKKDRK